MKKVLDSVLAGSSTLLAPAPRSSPRLQTCITFQQSDLFFLLFLHLGPYRSAPAYPPPPEGLPMTLSPAQTLWGHGARVWDAVLAGALLVTGSEDCTARLWDWKQGRCLAVLQVC